MKWFIIKEKIICQELNKLEDSGEKFLNGLFWCPEKYKEILFKKLAKMKKKRLEP